MDPIDRSIGLWLADNAHGRIRQRRKPAGEKCCIDLSGTSRIARHVALSKRLSDGKRQLSDGSKRTVGKVDLSIGSGCQYWTYMVYTSKRNEKIVSKMVDFVIYTRFFTFNYEHAGFNN